VEAPGTFRQDEGKLINLLKNANFTAVPDCHFRSPPFSIKKPPATEEAVGLNAVPS